jgi:hypothetical protein
MSHLSILNVAQATKEHNMSMVQWETTKVDQVTEKKRVKGADAVALGLSDDGKWHTVTVDKKELDYTYPKIDTRQIQTPEALAQALNEILAAQKPGFIGLAVLVDHINYGLYANTRGIITRGADVRYNTAQRNCIKKFCELVKDDMIEPEQAVALMLRQGINDAQAWVDKALASRTTGESVEVGEAVGVNGVNA